MQASNQLTHVIGELQARFAQEGVQLELSFKPVKNVNFRYHNSVLKVSAPTRIRALEIERLLLAKLPWAVKVHQKNAAKEVAAKGVFSKDLAWGDSVRWWGQSRVLRCSTHEPSSYSVSESTLVAAGADAMSAYRAQLKRSLQSALDERMAYWSARTGLTASKVTIKLMRTRWGSCNKQNRQMSISLTIAMQPPECLDALIVHELCHLVHANHGSQFWELVYRYLPNYAQLHKLLS